MPAQNLYKREQYHGIKVFANNEMSTTWTRKNRKMEAENLTPFFSEAVLPK